MAVQYHGCLMGSGFRRFLSSFHSANSKCARYSEAPPHDRREYEATIQQQWVVVPVRGSTGPELRQILQVARPTAQGADELD